MENNEIISIVINKMNEEDLWFTQKTDPTWGNPSHYYKLDEYGNPTESSIKEIVKEVTAYIGDGAVGPDDAVDIWIQEALADYRIAYTSTLVTKFKDKPVVDGIEAYNSNVLKEEYNKKEESSDYVSKFDELDELLDIYAVSEIDKVSLYNHFNNTEISDLKGNNDELYDNWLDDMKENHFKELMDYLKELDDETATYIDKINENKLLKEHTETSLKVLDKDSHLVKPFVDYFKSEYPKEDIKNVLLEIVEGGWQPCVAYIETATNTYRVFLSKLNDGMYMSDKDSIKLAKSNYKSEYDYIDENKQIKKEDYKRRLKEENNKSANLISQMFQADDFDSDSKAGQIVMRTSELFNALSDKGYDVQVAFDNGESTNTILLGQQGGQVIITITDTNQPLRAFTSGNFEINDDNIQVLSDIKEQISTI